MSCCKTGLISLSITLTLYCISGEGYSYPNVPPTNSSGSCVSSGYSNTRMRIAPRQTLPSPALSLGSWGRTALSPSTCGHKGSVRHLGGGGQRSSLFPAFPSVLLSVGDLVSEVGSQSLSYLLGKNADSYQASPRVRNEEML